MLRNILQPFYTAYILITFLAGLLIGLPVFTLLAIANNKKARAVIYYIVKYWAKAWLWLIGMPMRISGPRPPEGKYVIVANHISYMDIVVLFPTLPGYFRPLGKKEMSRIPVFGFLYKQLTILVDRSSPHSRAKSMRLMWRILQHESSILIYPEGTFNETGAPLKTFYDGAFRLAINAQTPVLPIIFPDTVHRWHYSAWYKLWPGRNRAIYLPHVPTKGLTISDLDSLKQQVYDAMEKALVKAG